MSKNRFIGTELRRRIAGVKLGQAHQVRNSKTYSHNQAQDSIYGGRLFQNPDEMRSFNTSRPQYFDVERNGTWDDHDSVIGPHLQAVQDSRSTRLHMRAAMLGDGSFSLTPLRPANLARVQATRDRRINAALSKPRRGWGPEEDEADFTFIGRND